jgi:hypothetical protein
VSTEKGSQESRSPEQKQLAENSRNRNLKI